MELMGRLLYCVYCLCVCMCMCVIMVLSACHRSYYTPLSRTVELLSQAMCRHEDMQHDAVSSLLETNRFCFFVSVCITHSSFNTCLHTDHQYFMLWQESETNWVTSMSLTWHCSNNFWGDFGSSEWVIKCPRTEGLTWGLDNIHHELYFD